MLTKIAEDLLQIIGGLLRDAINMILGHLNMDMSVMEEALPVLKGCVTVMITLGSFIIVCCSLTEALQLTAQPVTGQEKKGGAMTFARIGLATALTIGIIPLLKAIMPTLQNMYDTFLNITNIGAEANFGTLEDQATSASLLQDISYGPIFGAIITILIFFQFFKIAASMFMRYITFGLCIYVSPICMSFGASESTANIPKSWARTFFSQIILFFLTAWAVNVMYNSLVSWESESNSEYWFFLVKCMIIYMFGKLILKLDEYLQRLGFNTMPTASSLGGGAIVAITTITRMAGRLKGGHGGSDRKGSSGAARGDRPGRMDTTFSGDGYARPADPKKESRGMFLDHSVNSQARAAYNSAFDKVKNGEKGYISNRQMDELFGITAGSDGKIRLDPDGIAEMDEYGGLIYSYSENVGGDYWMNKGGYLSPDGVTGVYDITQGGGSNGSGVSADKDAYVDHSASGFTLDKRYRNLDQGATTREIHPIKVEEEA